MRCRRLKTWIDSAGNKHTDVVWFGSYGVNESNGNAKFFNPIDKHDNFSSDSEAVVDSLTQRLSILKKELWYNVNYGLPLVDHPNKIVLDTTVAAIIEQHPDVVAIIEFSSTLQNRQYSCLVKILSKFGQMEVNI